MTKQHRWLALALGMIVALVGSVGYFLIKRTDRNWSSSAVFTLYTIPDDRRAPWIRTYRQSEIDQKTPRQRQAIKQSVLNLDGAGPLLEFNGKPQTLKFRFFANKQPIVLEGNPTLRLIATDYDNRAKAITRRYRLSRISANQYQVRLTDLFAAKKLTKYNVVANDMLEIHFTANRVRYVTYTAFTTGH
ncbi:hypothetical protein [Lacticaseibacillus sp. GG6-2]